MFKFLIKKILQGVLMILAVSAITFWLLASAGGDAFTALRDNPQISERTIEHLRSVYGLDKPVSVRYVLWLAGAARGELGDSLQFRVPAAELIYKRLLNTTLLAAAALCFAIILSVSLSFLSVRFPNRFLSASIEFLILITASAPRIVLALIALALSVRASGGAFGRPSDVLMFFIAAFILAIPLIAVFLAQSRQSLERAMKQDFVKLARAKGLSEAAVILRHASRDAVGPLLTIFGMSLGGLLGGSVIVETVLGWPGIGSLMISSVLARDVPVVMGVVLFTSFAVWLGNAAAEVLQALNDRRILQSEVNW